MVHVFFISYFLFHLLPKLQNLKFFHTTHNSQHTLNTNLDETRGIQAYSKLSLLLLLLLLLLVLVVVVVVVF